MSRVKARPADWPYCVYCGRAAAETRYVAHPREGGGVKLVTRARGELGEPSRFYYGLFCRRSCAGHFALAAYRGGFRMVADVLSGRTP